MTEETKPAGWWHTIPGILTAIAAILTAVGSLVLALHQAGLLGKATEGSVSASETSGPTRAACVPTLAIPANDAVLPQRRLDNQRVEANWMFGWRACPEASKYHLFVIGPGAISPIVNSDSITSVTFQHRSTYYHGVTQNDGWSWKVRAYVDGQWGAWSEERKFQRRAPIFCT